MNQKDYEANINRIWDWIDECQALDSIVHGYPNDAIDVDKEGCFVYKYQPGD